MNGRKLVLLIVLIFATASLALASQDQEPNGSAKKPANFEDVQKEMGDLLATLKDYSANEQDKAVEQTKEVLAKIDQRIEMLETEIDRNWDAMSEEARMKARQSMQEFRQQRLKAAEWLGSLKTSSVVAWEQIKQGFSDAYLAFSDSWKDSEENIDSAIESAR
jgi:cytochrome c556